MLDGDDLVTVVEVILLMTGLYDGEDKDNASIDDEGAGSEDIAVINVSEDKMVLMVM